MNQLEFQFEEWRVVEGYEGCYEVSNFGRVRNLARMVRTKGGAFHHVAGRIRQPNLDGHGRLKLGLSIRGKCKTFPIHVLVAHAFIGVRPPGMTIHHKDFNALNNTAWNLAYVSMSENIQANFDSGYRTGLRGERCPTAKLRTQDVIEIRRMRLEGMELKEIARIFSISVPTVSEIANRAEMELA